MKSNAIYSAKNLSSAKEKNNGAENSVVPVVAAVVDKKSTDKETLTGNPATTFST